MKIVVSFYIYIGFSFVYIEILNSFFCNISSVGIKITDSYHSTEISMSHCSHIINSAFPSATNLGKLNKFIL